MRDVVHDCLVDFLGRKPTKLELMRALEKLPHEITLEAEVWGEWDTEIVNKVHNFIDGLLNDRVDQ